MSSGRYREEAMNQESRMDELTPGVRNAVNAALAPAEQVLWCGKLVGKAARGFCLFKAVIYGIPTTSHSRAESLELTTYISS
jgi:hypothetical protein